MRRVRAVGRNGLRVTEARLHYWILITISTISLWL